MVCSVCEEREARFTVWGSGRWQVDEDHDMCPQCWRDEMNRRRAGPPKIRMIEPKVPTWIPPPSPLVEIPAPPASATILKAPLLPTRVAPAPGCLRCDCGARPSMFNYAGRYGNPGYTCPDCASSEWIAPKFRAPGAPAKAKPIGLSDIEPAHGHAKNLRRLAAARAQKSLLCPTIERKSA